MSVLQPSHYYIQKNLCKNKMKKKLKIWVKEQHINNIMKKEVHSSIATLHES